MCFLRHAPHGFQQRFVFFVQPDRDAVPAGTESGVIFAAADGNAAPQKRRVQSDRCAQQPLICLGRTDRNVETQKFLREKRPLFAHDFPRP